MAKRKRVRCQLVEDRGFRRVNEMCAAKPVDDKHFNTEEER